MDKLTVDEVAENAGAKNELVGLSSTETIGAALDSMDKNKLAVAPVKNAEGEFCALLSVFDLVNYAVLEKLSPDSVGSLEPDSVPALKDTVGDVVASGYKRFRLPIFKKSVSIFEVMKEYSIGKHKVLVTEEDGAPLYLFSQHDLIRFLNQNPSSIPEELLAKTAADLEFTPVAPIVTSTTNATVLDILRLLQKNDMTAVPLLDEKEQLAGTFSQSDLKGLATVMLVDLKMEAMKFLEEVETRGAGRPLSVKPDARLGEIVLPLAYSGAHRVWVTDADNKVTGVASMTDVIAKVAKVLGA